MKKLLQNAWKLFANVLKCKTKFKTKRITKQIVKVIYTVDVYISNKS